MSRIARKFFTKNKVFILWVVLFFPLLHTQAQESILKASTGSINSESYPNDTAWYNNPQATFSWDLPRSVVAVRTLYDTQPDSVPSKVYDPAIASKSFTVDEDGIYYMHVQFKDASGWGEVAHRKFQIDTHPPKALSVSLVEGTTTTTITPTVLVTAEDVLSGLDHVSIAVDGYAPMEYPIVASNAYKVSKLSPGRHTLVVSVFDRAGNKVSATLELTINKLDTPTIIDYTRRVERGEKVTISGITYPNKTVEIIFTDENRDVVFETTRTTSDGGFTYVLPRKLETGLYDMAVRVVDDNGATSDYTESRTVAIENTKFMRTGMFIVNWLSLALIIILSGTLIIATLWYSVLQFARFRRKIKRSMKEVEQTLKANVAALRRDTEEFHTILVKAEKKRELTKEEQQILKKFRKRLDITEKEIEKKLGRIG